MYKRKEDVAVKLWKEILFNGDDGIIFHGKVYRLKAKNLGYLCVEDIIRK